MVNNCLIFHGGGHYFRSPWDPKSLILAGLAAYKAALSPALNRTIP